MSSTPSIKRLDPWRTLAGMVCAGVALSAAAAIPASVLAAKPLWFMLGFEMVVLVAAVFGVLLATGRFATGPGLGLLCVCGAIAVASLLEDQTSRLSNPLAGPIVCKLQSWDITLFFALRGMAAGVVGACAAGVVLSRRPRESIRALAIGSLLGVLVLVVIVAGRVVMHAGLGAFVNTLVGFAFAALTIGLLGASVHFTVKAFQTGRLDGSSPAGGG